MERPERNLSCSTRANKRLSGQDPQGPGQERVAPSERAPHEGEATGVTQSE